MVSGCDQWPDGGGSSTSSAEEAVRYCRGNTVCGVPCVVPLPSTLCSTPITLCSTPSTLCSTPSPLCSTSSTLCSTLSTLCSPSSTLCYTPGRGGWGRVPARRGIRCVLAAVLPGSEVDTRGPGHHSVCTRMVSDIGLGIGRGLRTELGIAVGLRMG